MRFLSLFFTLSVLFSPFIVYLVSAGCHSTIDAGGPPNEFPIFNGTENMKLVNSSANGKLYQVTVPNGGNASSFFVIHVYGSPYEMGYAQGTLLGSVAKDYLTQVWAYMESEVESAIQFLPTWLQELIAKVGLDVALELTYEFSKAYSGPYFFQEMQGISDAAGIDYNQLLRIHMIAGLTEGKCSMFGAWGAALDPNYGSNLLQLRALDWDMDGPFRDYASITVYHPTEGGHPFAIVGFPGFIGGLTGASSTQLAISEIGVDYPDSTFGSESRIGVPFIFTLRDILQFDETIDDSINRLINEKRTCDLILGVGDGKVPEFRGFEYSSSVLNVFDDMNLEPYNQTWHPRIPNVVYWGMDWLCPYYNEMLSKQIQEYYGKITPEVAIRYLTAVEQSGDNHLAYTDLTNMEMFVSFAAPHNVGGPIPAYQRQFTWLNLTDLFNEPVPSV